MVDSTAAGGVFVGVDWGNSHHQLCMLDPVGRVVAQGKFAHDVAGIRELSQRLNRHGPIAGIAIERSEGLLVEALQEHGHRLFCVSPKMSARARERYRLAPTKSDAFDAFVLADSLRHEHRHWRSLAVPSPLLAELRALTRDRERLIWNQRDVENQLRAIVLTYYPSVLHLFSSLDRDITLAFLRDYPTPGHAGRVGTTRMAAFCARHGYSGRTRPELLVDRLRTNLLSASPGTTAGKAFSAALFVDQLDLLNTQIRTITKRIRDLLVTHPDAAIFLSFPGMGHVTAATMLAEMGEDRGRFPTADVLLAETGTAPVTRSSGRSRNVRFRYAANKRMRHAIDWWAFVSVRENDWAREAYQQARARGQLHNRALRGLGARWTRILWRCWTDHTTYDPHTHLKSQPVDISS
ncbi:MAG: IS110 family transposase [Nocardioidaceae bacterium]|nr:IS110 family transposase [Nocardioidaceae bacterium]